MKKQNEMNKRRQQLNDAADIAITAILIIAIVVIALLLNKYSIINIF